MNFRRLSVAGLRDGEGARRPQLHGSPGVLPKGKRPVHAAGDLVSDLAGREAAVLFEKARKEGNPAVERGQIFQRRDDGFDHAGPGTEYPGRFPTRVERLQGLLETGPALRGRKRHEADAVPVEQPRVVVENLLGESPQPLQQRLVPPLRDEGSALGQDQPRELFPIPRLAEEHRRVLDVSGLFQESGGGPDGSLQIPPWRMRLLPAGEGTPGRGRGIRRPAPAADTSW